MGVVMDRRLFERQLTGCRVRSRENMETEVRQAEEKEFSGLRGSRMFPGASEKRTHNCG